MSTFKIAAFTGVALLCSAMVSTGLPRHAIADDWKVCTLPKDITCRVEGKPIVVGSGIIVDSSTAKISCWRTSKPNNAKIIPSLSARYASADGNATGTIIETQSFGEIKIEAGASHWLFRNDQKCRELIKFVRS
jgi:hypothetical protein